MLHVQKVNMQSSARVLMPDLWACTCRDLHHGWCMDHRTSVPWSLGNWSLNSALRLWNVLLARRLASWRACIPLFLLQVEGSGRLLDSRSILIELQSDESVVPTNSHPWLCLTQAEAGVMVVAVDYRSWADRC